jgi:predicted DNA-binding transcriptional regulator AlpA
MAALSLREASLPRLALRRDEAAASLSISPSTFDTWIKKGRVPKGKAIDGVTLWDVQKLREAWQKLQDADDQPEDDASNPFNGVVA